MPPINMSIFDKVGFGLSRSRDASPDSSQFILHNHNDVYEIVLFINGDAEYHAEGNVYKVKPYDMLIARPFELHRIVCRPGTPYERIVLSVETSFFSKNECERLTAVFENRSLGCGNLISGSIVKEELLESFNRICRYVELNELIIARAALIEFLYLLNHAEHSTTRTIVHDKRISGIIKYINTHLSDEITLEQLAEEFYINKYHLCRIFKKSTGYTVNRYINYKRLLVVRELHAKGQSLLEASINAGFNNYSHFYRMYVKQNGDTPKNM